MSIPNITNNMIQPQNIVINQMPLTHTIITNVNANNGIPIATALAHAPTTMEQGGDIKPTGIVVETIPIAGSGMGVPNVPIQGAATVKTVQNVPTSTVNSQQESSSVLLTKTRLNDLVRDTDQSLTLDDEVEELLLSYVDEFVDRVLNGAATLAKHRHVNMMEVKDVQHFVSRYYGIWTPGFGTDELKPYKRSLMTESHKQRLALIRKALKKY